MNVVLIVVVVLLVLIFIINIDYKMLKPVKRSIDIFKPNIPIKDILENRFDYYKKLSEEEKKIFITRVNDFIISKKFVGASKFEVTIEMKVLISAAATQITFGLNEMLFTMFNTIIVHEDIYYNRFTRKYHKGDVNTKGVISLSWKHFQEGYNLSYDKVNLGIHEMAHVLFLNRKKILYHQKYSKHFFDKFIIVFQKAFLELKNSESNLIREYGKTSLAEFFPSITEMFFEAPHEFKNTMPELYLQLCIFLNQDPVLGHYSKINIKDYFNKPNIPKIDKLSKDQLIFAPKTNFFKKIINEILLFIGIFILGSLFFLTNEEFIMIPIVFAVLLIITGGKLFFYKYIMFYDIRLFNEYLVIQLTNFYSDSRLYVNYENIFSITNCREGYEVKYLEYDKINYFIFDISLKDNDLITLKSELLKKNIRF